MAQEGEVFAQVEPLAQLRDGGLAGADLLGFRRAAQPGGEGVLSVGAAGEVKALEKAAGAEQVQVAGTGVGVVNIGVALFAGASPGVLKVLQAPFVEA